MSRYFVLSLVLLIGVLGTSGCGGDRKGDGDSDTDTDTDADCHGDIVYPAEGDFGPNLLEVGATEYTAGRLSLRAELPVGSCLRVKIRLLAGSAWGIDAIDQGGWDVSEYDSDNDEQEFAVAEGGVTADMFIGVLVGRAEIEYYENGDDDATRVKVVDWVE